MSFLALGFKARIPNKATVNDSAGCALPEGAQPRRPVGAELWPRLRP